MLLTHLITYIYIMLTKILKFKYIKKKTWICFFLIDVIFLSLLIFFFFLLRFLSLVLAF